MVNGFLLAEAMTRKIMVSGFCANQQFHILVTIKYRRRGEYQ